MQPRTLAFAAMMLVAPIAAASESDDIVALERQRSEAIATHDIAFLGGLYGDDFRGVTALGYVVDKKALMEVFGRDNPNTKFSLDELQARVFGETAILTGRLTGRDQSGAVVNQSRYIHVYVRRGGHWVLIAGEGTDIPKDMRN